MKKKLELKKHIGTIQCSNSLGLVQRKISNALLYHSYNELLEKDEHVIEIRQLCQLIGYDSHDYDLIKKALKTLLSTVMEWNILRDNKGNDLKENIWSASSILASVSIQGSMCIYSYSPRMKQLLYMPSMYGRVDLITQSKFKSSYALALYENCIRYQSLAYTGWFDIELFRKLMGVAPGKYKVHRDFKRRIIDKAVSEVNQYSNLYITPEVKRLQRKVVSIRFKIEHKEEIEHASTDASEQTKILVKEWGLKIDQAERLVFDYGIDSVNAKIAEVSKTAQTQQIRNKGAYLIACFKNVQKVSNKPKLFFTGNKRKRVGFRQDAFNLINSKFKEEGIQEKVQEEFIEHLKKNHEKFLWKYFVESGWDHLAVKAEFMEYSKKHYASIIDRDPERNEMTNII